jgi:hypothetical protein
MKHLEHHEVDLLDIGGFLILLAIVVLVSGMAFVLLR